MIKAIAELRAWLGRSNVSPNHATMTIEIDGRENLARLDADFFREFSLFTDRPPKIDDMWIMGMRVKVKLSPHCPCCGK